MSLQDEGVDQEGKPKELGMSLLVSPQADEKNSQEGLVLSQEKSNVICGLGSERILGDTSRQKELRFGDSIALKPARVNGVLAFASDRGWVETLSPEVSVPPNLEDCRFKIIPRMHHGEKKVVKKMIKAGLWDEGKRLPPPELPAGGLTLTRQHLELLATRFADEHGITNKKGVVHMFAAVQSARSEILDNEVEIQRQSGTPLRFGDHVQLLHVRTRTMVTISKSQSIQRSGNAIEFDPFGGGHASVFEIQPAYRISTQGELVSSGDLVTFVSMKKFEGGRCYLDVSNLNADGLDRAKRPAQGIVEYVHSRENVLESLRCDSAYILNGEEVLASQSATFWRALLFSSHNKSTRGEFCGEDYVGLYHKDAESYLCYEPSVSDKLLFMASTRVSSKARKKSSWIWKIEKDSLLCAGEPILCVEGAYYRIKHVAANLYLARDPEGGLTLKADYNNHSTLWSFKSLTRAVVAAGTTHSGSNAADDAGEDKIMSNTLVYVHQRGGGWLTHRGDTHVLGGGGGTDECIVSGASLSMQKSPNERDALQFLPAREEDVEAVLAMRSRHKTLATFRDNLCSIPIAATNHGQSFEPSCMPIDPGYHAETVLDVVASHFTVVASVLQHLVESTKSRSSDTIMAQTCSVMQKLLRELQVLDTIVELIQAPIERGIDARWLTDPRCAHLRELYVLLMTVLKHSAAGIEKNARVLLQHLPILDKFLGKGVAAMDVIKSIYAGRRDLLSQIDEVQVDKYVSQLMHDTGRITTSAVRAVSFLSAMCSCDGIPIPKNQDKIIALMFAPEKYGMIPKLLVTMDGGQAHLVAEVVGKDGEVLTSLNMQQFCEEATNAEGQKSELGEVVLEEKLEELDEDALLFVYVHRLLELFAEMAFGRNQTVLGVILRYKYFGFEYPQILQSMFSPAMPVAIRAKFVKLMQRLYVDREPQSSKPQVLFTRAWSKVEKSVEAPAAAKIATWKNRARTNMMLTRNLGQTQLLPVCTTGFDDLSMVLFRELPKLGGLAEVSRGEGGVHSKLSKHTTISQIVYVRELMDLVDLMLDFNIIAPDRDKVNADYSDVQAVCSVIFSIIDVSGGTSKDRGVKKGILNRSRNASELAKLRSRALNVLWRIFNLRGNHRISLAVQCWETVFDEMQEAHILAMPRRSSQLSLTLSDQAARQDRAREVRNMFERFQPQMEKLNVEMFEVNYVSPPHVSADRVPEVNEDTSRPVESLLTLFCASTSEPRLAVIALKCLFRQVMQKATTLQELRQVQLLSYPEAVKLNGETDQAIRRLTALKKHLYSNREEAYEQVRQLVKELTAFVVPSETLSKAVIAKNQIILLNREMDDAVCKILSLSLERRARKGHVFMDYATNTQRKDMFKVIYEFLTHLVRENRQAQTKLYPLVSVFADHLGIEGLPVADTIAEIFRNNPTLLTQVKTRFLGRFVELIHRHGLEARWLAIFKVFLQIDGRPFKRCQDLIVNLLVEDSAVIDLQCDYSQGAGLSWSDWRKGLSRKDLMRRREHRKEDGSLLRYHAMGIEVLSMCATGKNPSAKALLSNFISLRQIVSNILETENPCSGTVGGSLAPPSPHQGGNFWGDLPPGSPFFGINRMHSSEAQHSSQKQHGISKTSSVASEHSITSSPHDPLLATDKMPMVMSGGKGIRQGNWLGGRTPSHEISRCSSDDVEDDSDHFSTGTDHFNDMGSEEKTLEEDLGPNGRIDVDTIHFIQRPWVMLLTDVYLSSLEQAAIEALMCTPRVWSEKPIRGTGGGAASKGHAPPMSIGPLNGKSTSLSNLRRRNSINMLTKTSLLQEFAAAISLLEVRLASVTEPQNLGAGGHEAHVFLAGHEDDHGKDLGAHLQYVHEIMRALNCAMGRKDLFVHMRNGPVPSLMADIRRATQKLSVQLARFKAGKMAEGVAELDGILKNWGVPGDDVAMPHGSGRGSVNIASMHTKEDAFNRGWLEMCDSFTSLSMGVHTSDAGLLLSMSTTELAMLFGSEKTPGNRGFAALRHLLHHCSQKFCDPEDKVIALRTARAILYIMPDSATMTDTQRKVEIGNFVHNRPPGHRGTEEMKALQTKLASIGAVNTVLCNMQADNKQGTGADTKEVLSALRLAVSLLDGGNRDVQNMFSEALEQPASQDFFKMVCTLLDMSLYSVKEEKRSQKQRRAENERRMLRGGKAVPSSVGYDDTERIEVGESDEGDDRVTALHFTFEVLKVTRRMCQGQHRALQDILRRQPLNRESVDLYQECIKFLTVVEPVIKTSLDRGEVLVPQTITRTFLMLGDAMHGPNRQNQESISNTGIFDLADRIMAKVRLESSSQAQAGGTKGADYLLRRGTGLLQSAAGLMDGLRKGSSPILATSNSESVRSRTSSIMLSEMNQQIADEALKHEKAANEMRTAVKTSVLTCLLAFLEGSQREDEVPKKMLGTLHWANFAFQMNQCYKFGTSPNVTTPDDNTTEQEGIQYYFLMRYLQHYDTQGTIEREFCKYPDAVAYYGQRTGYIEIARNEVIEHVFFLLPQVCLPGGVLNRQFEEMYVATRENSDTKCHQFLQNMLRILEREQHHAGIRETHLAWTVDRWDQICQATFNMSLLTNAILIMGGYTDSDYLIPEACKAADSAGAFFATSQNSGYACVPEGNYDEIFASRVLPMTVAMVSYLGWVSLGFAAARAFSFFWARFPLILLNVRSAQVEQQNLAKASRDPSFRKGTRNNTSAMNMEPSNTSIDDDECDDPLGDEQRRRKRGMDARSRGKAFWRTCCHPQVIYEVLFLTAAFLAVALGRPLLSVFGLFEMCFWSGSRTAIDAIRFNIHKMGQTMLLGLLTLYLWMVIGLSTLYDAHEPGTCINMFQCLMTYLYRAIRQDGVKDVLRPAVFPTNVADALLGEGAFAWRLLWDISFWLLFVLILISIISGIIIDAFSGMRDEQEAAAEDRHNRCFVCNLDRFTLDQHGVGFDRHISEEHNPLMYLYFLLYLKMRSPALLTGQEAYVKSQVWPDVAHHWIPKESTLTLKRRGDGDASHTKMTVVKIERMVDSLATQMDKAMSAIASNQSVLLSLQDVVTSLQHESARPPRTSSACKGINDFAATPQTPVLEPFEPLTRRRLPSRTNASSRPDENVPARLVI